MIDVAALRSALADPLDVCHRLGLRVAKRQPRGALVCCSAHDDHTPSCSVRVGADGTIAVRCFACGFAGDVLHLIAAARGLSADREFPAVLQAAAELARVPLPEPRRSRKARPEQPTCSTIAFAAMARVLAQLGGLDGSAIADDVTAYLDGRRLLAQARADGWFALPAAPYQRSWAELLLALAERGNDDIEDAAHRVRWTRPDVDTCGMFARRTMFAHAHNRLCIPWRDRDGRVQTLQRRRLDAGEPRYVFPAGRRPSWPYGVERLHEGVPLVLVEGAIDVLAARALYARLGAARDVIGLPGATGWRPEWADLGLGRVVLLALDADAAGERAAGGIARDLYAAGAARVVHVRPIGAGDWADHAREVA